MGRYNSTLRMIGVGRICFCASRREQNRSTQKPECLSMRNVENNYTAPETTIAIMLVLRLTTDEDDGQKKYQNEPRRLGTFKTVL